MKIRCVLASFPSQTKSQKDLAKGSRFAEKLMRFLSLSFSSGENGNSTQEKNSQLQPSLGKSNRDFDIYIENFNLLETDILWARLTCICLV